MMCKKEFVVLILVCALIFLAAITDTRAETGTDPNELIIENLNPLNLPAGTFDENLNIICGENALKITQIQPAGSALMAFKDFTNGRQIQPGDSFVKIDK